MNHFNFSLEKKNTHPERQYLNLLEHIVKNGESRQDRTGIGTLGIFGGTLSFPLQNQFPLLTTKKLHFKSIVYELLWFLRGETNIAYLNKNGVSIWDEWANEAGELGPVYGSQWRKWHNKNGEEIDQVIGLINDIKNNPTSRRHILSAWNVGEIQEMALPPCHILSQFYVSSSGGLSCQLYQRSVDVFLGLPFNIASYALLTYILSTLCGLKPDMFYFVGGDIHLYKNHISQAKEQITRTPFEFPTLKLSEHFHALTLRILENHLLDKKTLDQKLNELSLDDFILENYQSHPAIKAEIAI